MKWDRSNVLGLAKAACKICQGDGMRISEQRGRETPCYCVFRAVFRACYNRFRECNLSSRTVTISLGTPRGPVGRQRFSRKREEYIADFCLISRRVLDDYEHRIFRYHFVLGADWRLCTRMLKMDRAFAETDPYPLFPVSEYFDVEVGQPARPPLPPPVRRQPNFKRLTLPLSA